MMSFLITKSNEKVYQLKSVLLKKKILRFIIISYIFWGLLFVNMNSTSNSIKPSRDPHNDVKKHKIFLERFFLWKITLAEVICFSDQKSGLNSAQNFWKVLLSDQRNWKKVPSAHSISFFLVSNVEMTVEFLKNSDQKNDFSYLTNILIWGK